MSVPLHCRRLAGLSALLAVAVLGTAGCRPAAPTGAGAATASRTPPAPRQALLAAVPTADGPGFQYRIDGLDVPLTGVVQPAARSLTVRIKQRDADLGFTTDWQFVVVDTRAWIKVVFAHTEGLTGLPKLPRSWLAIDPAKVTGKDGFTLSYDGDTDPGEAAAVFRSIVEARQTAPGHFAGTVDLTKEPDTDIAAAKPVKALGAKARSVPFEAVVDPAGRLASLLIRIPATARSKAARYAVSYRSYGTAPAVTQPPAGQTQPAPAAAYELLNS